MKYPNISTKLPENFVQKAVEALEISDEKFVDYILDFAEEWKNDALHRVLNEQVTLTKNWILPRYQIENIEEIAGKPLETSEK